MVGEEINKKIRPTDQESKLNPNFCGNIGYLSSELVFSLTELRFLDASLYDFVVPLEQNFCQNSAKAKLWSYPVVGTRWAPLAILSGPTLYVVFALNIKPFHSRENGNQRNGEVEMVSWRFIAFVLIHSRNQTKSSKPLWKKIRLCESLSNFQGELWILTSCIYVVPFTFVFFLFFSAKHLQTVPVVFPHWGCCFFSFKKNHFFNRRLL